MIQGKKAFLIAVDELDALTYDERTETKRKRKSDKKELDIERRNKRRDKYAARV